MVKVNLKRWFDMKKYFDVSKIDYNKIYTFKIGKRRQKMKALKMTQFKNGMPVKVSLTTECMTVRQAMKYLEGLGYKPISKTNRKLKYFYYNSETETEVIIMDWGKENVYKYSGITFDLWQKKQIEENGYFKYTDYEEFIDELIKDKDKFEKYQEASYKTPVNKNELLINLL